MMRVVGRLGRVLGPCGLMPTPKTGTILPAEDLPRVIEETRLGRVEFRVDKTSNIHAPIGKASFEDGLLMKNFASFMEAIMTAKPGRTEGQLLAPCGSDQHDGAWRQGGCERCVPIAGDRLLAVAWV